MDKTDFYEAIARTGKALSHGKRLELVELLAQGERPVQELARAVDLKLTTASAHLQVLRQAGLITARNEGTKIYYRLSGDDVATLTSLLSRVAEAHRAEVESIRRSYLGEEEVRPVKREQLMADAASGRALVLDVRPSEEFEAGHLPGAVSIPLEELAGRIDEIPSDVEVVAYCRGRYCVLSHEAARLLREHGHEASPSGEGILEWGAEGLVRA
ncbi:ArsR/SmtB family transcription factor [Nocardiopsis kunsanensis]|uniref:ArsR family transcriptional regulator n=1 Tax=Nocardiopsis kunsanensis TaxID=141693 RepID=A0A918XEP6_9ACTN|nr:metalloregulator ArsR/SmtB family transcription factor [Nocardiopsis kunsanensis]GHD29307.1 ArsR family transcriptional regulator [Nocardiopsis kunsanensis]